MKSTYQRIKRKATEADNGYYKFTVDKPTELLSSFAVGVGELWNSKRDEDGLKIEVWISARLKLEDILELNEGTVSIISVIKEYDDIPDYEREKIFSEKGAYDYHLSYIPSADVDHFFTYLYPYDINGGIKAVDEDK